MKRIAILTCLNSTSSVCTGMSCFNSFYNRSGAFERYDDELRLETFFSCNGCYKPFETDKGLQEKMERILSSNIDVIHVGVCTLNKQGVRCPTIEAMINVFKNSGIKIINGTHSHKRLALQKDIL